MRIKALLLLILLVVSFPSARSEALGVNAAAAILMDVNSARILYGKNVHAPMPIASLTKIMTALLAAESGRLGEIVTVREEWLNVEPSNVWLIPGERISLRTLVYGLMLRSGNDAALVIAYSLAECVEGFSQLMNERARTLGARNTNFVNPHGLHNREHFSTAFDLALITRAALQNPFLHVVVRTERYDSKQDGGDVPRVWHNKNRLLQIEDKADGVKTGWTRAAGHCLASSATFRGWQLLSIVLNSPDHYGENYAMLEWGFANFDPILVVPHGMLMGNVSVVGGQPSQVGALAADDFWWARARSEDLTVQVTTQLPPSISPPVAQFQVIGETILEFNGELVGRVPLISDREARVEPWWSWMARQIRRYARFALGLVVGLIR